MSDEANATVSIKVVASAGEEVFFKIKRSIKLTKLRDAYANKVGKDMNSIRFLYDGQRIQEDDTPATLGMEEGDAIDVMVEHLKIVLSIIKLLRPMATRIPSSYVIRQLKPTDASLLRTFRLQALATSPDSFTSTVSREESLTMEIWEERTARTPFVFELATWPENDTDNKSSVQEHPVGMVGYYWTEQGEIPIALLVSLWVHPSHRGKGLGSALVEWVVGRILPYGTDGASPRRRLQLDVDERNKK
ncbi:hypothetical protein FS837_000904, partial [Tulasnella sp. UAMH 9824]